MSARSVFHFYVLGLSLAAYPGLAGEAAPELDIQLCVQSNNLYLATSFTNQFLLERRGADLKWQRVGLFTDTDNTAMEWFRTVRLDGTPSRLDDSIVFTPGELPENSGAALPAAAGPWTLIRKGLGGDDSVYGPLLQRESPASPTEIVLGIPWSAQAAVFWSSTNGESAFWGLNTNGVRSTNGVVSTNLMPYDSSAHWRLAGAADITGDGRAELFWVSTNHTPQTWFLDSSNQVVSTSTTYGANIPLEYILATVGKGSVGSTNADDAYDDLFFQDLRYGYVDTWHMNTDGRLRTAVPTYADSIDTNWRLRCCGDVTGDGRVELFFQNTNTHATETWLLDPNGQQTAMNPMYPSIAAGWTMRCAGDATGDGRAEIFWQKSDGATCVWFLNTNGYATSSRRIYTKNISKGWTMKAATDVDADGRVELLWQHTNGSTAIWFLNTNGTLRSSRAMNSSAVSAKWAIRAVYSAPIYAR